MRRMRRLWLVAAVVALNAAALAQTPQLRPTQADPIVRLLSDLESALLSGRPEDLTPLAAPTLRADDRARFTRAVEGGNVTTATLRERARRRPLFLRRRIIAERRKRVRAIGLDSRRRRLDGMGHGKLLVDQTMRDSISRHHAGCFAPGFSVPGFIVPLAFRNREGTRVQSTRRGGTLRANPC